MISPWMTVRPEDVGLQNRIPALLLLMAVTSVPPLAFGQARPDPEDKTAISLDPNDGAVLISDKFRVLHVNGSLGRVGSAGSLLGEGESKVATSSATDNPAQEVPEANEGKKKKEKRGAIVAAPLPISSPAIGTGIVPLVGYIFPMDRNDKVTPPSLVGGTGLITNNGSRALALGGDLYLKRGAYEVRSAFLNGHLNYNFYGTGSVAGDAGRRLAITQTGKVFFGEGLRRLGWKFYLGPRVWVGHSEIAPDLSKSDTDHPNVPELYLLTDVKAFGVRLQRDSRPNRFYATSGTFFDFTTNFFYLTPNFSIGSGTGGTSNSSPGRNTSFQAYRLTFNKYGSLSQKQVLAYNLDLCAVNGEPPFYGECIFGTNNELRGYVAGRYIDRRMFATQLEYRRELPWRFGVTAFGGVGEVAPTVAMFRYRELLPAVGTGLRYNLSTQYHVNLRVDFAQGKNGHTWSMSVGEAF
jgi:hypothetical protein